MAVSFSLEIFPPKNAKSSLYLWKAINIYEQLKPKYISVTCHASGTDAGLTDELVEAMSVRPKATPIAPHMVCYGQTQQAIEQQLQKYVGYGISNLVALRGDKNPDTEPGEFNYASDLVQFVRDRGYPLQLHVAGYPECHPESPGHDADFRQLKKKVDAGASSIITQFFFDPDVFLAYRDRVKAAGIDIPVIPGILPILDFARMVIFAEKCQAGVPDFLFQMFEDGKLDKSSQQLLAMNVLTHQITKLHANGIEHFHFYTLNELRLTSQTCRWMQAAL